MRTEQQSPIGIWEFSRTQAEIEGWADNPGDPLDLACQIEYGVDPEHRPDTCDEADVDADPTEIGLGKAACTDQQLEA